jgi:AraC-like DNA-binding protein
MHPRMHNRPPSAAACLVESLVDATEHLGIDPRRVRDALSLDGGAMSSPDRRIALDALHPVWPLLRRELGNQPVGLLLAGSIRPEMWDLFGRALGVSVSLADALVRAGRFIPLLVEAVDLQLEVRGDRALVVYRGWTPTTAHPDSVEFGLGVIVHFGAHLAGRPLPLEAVRFAHAAPADRTTHRRVFGAEPEFLRAHNAIVVRTANLHQPIPGHDTVACALAERDAQLRLAGLPRAESLVRRIEENLRRGLRDGAPTIDRMAEALGMRSRTLSRRLRSEGATFQDVLDSVRHGLADRYLSDGDMSITEVAYALGYSDPSAFNKAFRRWTGRAPHEYRRHAHLEAS